MRTIAIDYGIRYCGLAISDASNKIAFPHSRIDLKKEDLIVYLKKTIAEKEVGLILLGLPLHLDGRESKLSQAVRIVKEQLEKELQLPVLFQDERFSSMQAQRNRQALSLFGKENIDETAAALILQSYLDKL